MVEISLAGNHQGQTITEAVEEILHQQDHETVKCCINAFLWVGKAVHISGKDDL